MGAGFQDDGQGWGEPWRCLVNCSGVFHLAVPGASDLNSDVWPSSVAKRWLWSPLAEPVRLVRGPAAC